jgi:hypothetical protein
MLAHFMVLWNILRSFGIFLWPFGNVVVIWCSFPRFGKLRQEKSGNPALNLQSLTDPIKIPTLVSSFLKNQGPMLWFLECFGRKTLSKMLLFLTQNVANFLYIMILTIVLFKKIADFVPESL